MSPRVPDQKVSLLLPLLRRRCLRAFTFCFEFGLTPPHGATSEDFGVIVHVRGGESLYCKVDNPTTDLIVTRRDEVALFSVHGVSDREGRPTAAAMGRQVRWINAVAQEYVYLHSCALNSVHLTV